MGEIVVFDPNVWISFAWNADTSLISNAVEQGFILASSQKAFDELASVLSRKKFTRRISEKTITNILQFYQSNYHAI